MNSLDIDLKLISSSDYRFLFNLLKERDLRANISHRKMPTFSQHIKFINSKPYSKWYIIKKSNSKLGSIYLSKNNEIGIFLKKQFHGKGFATEALKLLIEKNPRRRYLANVSPKNQLSKNFFIKNNFKLIQYTFEKNMDE